MTIYRLLMLTLLAATATISIAAPPQEYVGSYIGVMNRKSLNAETGKAGKLPSLAVELKIEANSTVTLIHTESNNTYPCPLAIVGQKNFTYRFHADNTAFVIKGKFTGKGKKLKAEIVQSSPAILMEGKISAKKM